MPFFGVLVEVVAVASMCTFFMASVVSPRWCLGLGGLGGIFAKVSKVHPTTPASQRGGGCILEKEKKIKKKELL